MSLHAGNAHDSDLPSMKNVMARREPSGNLMASNIRKWYFTLSSTKIATATHARSQGVASLGLARSFSPKRKIGKCENHVVLTRWGLVRRRRDSWYQHERSHDSPNSGIRGSTPNRGGQPEALSTLRSGQCAGERRMLRVQLVRSVRSRSGSCGRGAVRTAEPMP